MYALHVACAQPHALPASVAGPGGAPPPPQGSDEEKAEALGVLVAVLEALRIVAVGLAPVTPALSARIMAQLGLKQEPGQVRVRERVCVFLRAAGGEGGAIRFPGCRKRGGGRWGHSTPPTFCPAGMWWLHQPLRFPAIARHDHQSIIGDSRGPPAAAKLPAGM